MEFYEQWDIEKPKLRVTNFLQYHHEYGSTLSKILQRVARMDGTEICAAEENGEKCQKFDGEYLTGYISIVPFVDVSRTFALREIKTGKPWPKDIKYVPEDYLYGFITYDLDIRQKILGGHATSDRRLREAYEEFQETESMVGLFLAMFPEPEDIRMEHLHLSIRRSHDLRYYPHRNESDKIQLFEPRTSLTISHQGISGDTVHYFENSNPKIAKAVRTRWDKIRRTMKKYERKIGKQWGMTVTNFGEDVRTNATSHFELDHLTDKEVERVTIQLAHIMQEGTISIARDMSSWREIQEKLK